MWTISSSLKAIIESPKHPDLLLFVTLFKNVLLFCSVSRATLLVRSVVSSFQIFLKNIFSVLVCAGACVSVLGCVRMTAGACEVQKRVLRLLELEP